MAFPFFFSEHDALPNKLPVLPLSWLSSLVKVDKTFPINDFPSVGEQLCINACTCVNMKDRTVTEIFRDFETTQKIVYSMILSWTLYRKTPLSEVL